MTCYVVMQLHSFVVTFWLVYAVQLCSDWLMVPTTGNQIIGMYQVQSRIWPRDGLQLLRPKVANVVKLDHPRIVSHLWLVSRACLRALEAFGFLMLKYAFSHILDTLLLSLLQLVRQPKTDKNSTSKCTSINLRYSYILHPFFNLHEKVMSLILNEVSKWSKARTFFDMSGTCTCTPCSIKYIKPISICSNLYDMIYWVKWGWKILEFKLWKIARYYRN